MKPGPRTNQRRARTEELLREGRTYSQIMRTLTAEFGVSNRTSKKDIELIRRRLATTLPSERAAQIEADEEKRERFLRSAEIYDSLGDPPTDPLAANRWICQTILTAMRESMKDQTLAPELRREELRKLASSYKGLVPVDRLHEVEQMLRADAEDIDEDRGPQVEYVGKSQDSIRGKAR